MSTTQTTTNTFITCFAREGEVVIIYADGNCTLTSAERGRANRIAQTLLSQKPELCPSDLTEKLLPLLKEKVTFLSVKESDPIVEERTTSEGGDPIVNEEASPSWNELRPVDQISRQEISSIRKIFLKTFPTLAMAYYGQENDLFHAIKSDQENGALNKKLNKAIHDLLQASAHIDRKQLHLGIYRIPNMAANDLDSSAFAPIRRATKTSAQAAITLATALLDTYRQHHTEEDGNCDYRQVFDYLEMGKNMIRENKDFATPRIVGQGAILQRLEGAFLRNLTLCEPLDREIRDQARRRLTILERYENGDTQQ